MTAIWSSSYSSFFFFFQAEDGIRDKLVTGVQTCALPIYQVPVGDRSGAVIEPMLTDQWFLDLTSDTRVDGRPGPGGRKAITEPALNAVRSEIGRASCRERV